MGTNFDAVDMRKRSTQIINIVQNRNLKSRTGLSFVEVI